MPLIPSLISGLAFSMLLGIIITIILIINPRYELKSYPTAIKQMVPAQTKEEKRKIKRGAMILIPLIILFLLADYYFRIRLDTQFVPIFLHFLIVFLTWTLFDLIIMDWLIFCTITPKFLIIPGSEGAKEYKDYFFHLRGLYIGAPVSVVFAIILSLLVTALDTAA